jgi:DNA-binding NarL/FixJ family response regulator
MAKTLLVEDNIPFRQSFKETLHSRFPSMEIVEAGDGKEAFQRIKASPPDIIFMDIKLPGENGLILTKKIKAEYPKIFVIVLTSYDLPEYREAAFQNHANHFFTKASPTHEIVKVVESVLDGDK